MGSLLDAIFGNPDGNNSGAGSNATVDGHNAVVERNGNDINVYFGGENGDPLGTGHGHIATNTSGETTYVREPGQDGQRGEVVTDSKAK